MPFGRRNRSFTIWLLCVALTANALLPSLSYALARAVGIDATEICTSTGIVRPAARDAAVPGAAALPAGDEDARPSGSCAWCLAQAGCVGLPPPERACAAIAPHTHFFAPEPLDSTPRVRFVPSARPRAPPR
ncbi:MAG TPA: DUF2946 domain-containing protein [Zeimonas sp.]|nr:DUF2946 domain-containing protein [Zeimonas sp.]